MRRLKLFAMASLLAIPLAACDEGTEPPPVGSIEGQVSIEGKGADGVTVTLSDGKTATTAGGGTFSFRNVEGGSYTVTISGFPTDASFTATSQAAVISQANQVVSVNFTGAYIRTSSIIGTVTVEGAGIGKVTVRLSGMSDASATTSDNGQYAFTGLRAGTYTVEISEFGSDEVSFSNTSQSATVAVGESQVISFDGVYLRTASITGQVSVEGTGLEGVKVSLTGMESKEATTDASGQYAFSNLREGDYSVGISGFDTDSYGFEKTSMDVSVALGETKKVAFEGTMLRTAGISGQVSVEGTGLKGVKVNLSGASAAETTTDASGQYAFAGLEAGDYTVAISGFDDKAYGFDPVEMKVKLGNSESKIQNFAGTHLRSASVSGSLFVDENTKNDMFDTGAEDMLKVAGVEVVLQGPGVNDRANTVTDKEGAYKFDELKAGDYRVMLLTDSLPKAIEGYAFGGDLTGKPVTVAPGSATSVHFPFDITDQTIKISAVMGSNKKDAKDGAAVKGVKMDLYATLQAVNTGKVKLGSATTDSTGMASFVFKRAADDGPGGVTDNLVFAKVTDNSHADLKLMTSEVMEISYASKDKESHAAQKVKLLNQRASFSFSVKNIKTTSGAGDQFLKGWGLKVGTETKKKDSLHFVDAEASDATGKSVFTGTASVDSLPMKYYVTLADVQKEAKGEEFEAKPEASKAATSQAATKKTPGYLVYTHDGMMLPGKSADLGLLRVKFTTQTLVAGVHYEIDQREGYSGNIAGGDVRPSKDAAAAIEIELQILDKNGRTRKYKGTRNPRSPNPYNAKSNPGLVVFNNLPTDTVFVLKARVSGNRDIAGSDEIDTWRNLGENSLGAFGDEGGVGPEVQVCPLTDRRSRQLCSTFAYVWADGMVSGLIKSRDYDGEGPDKAESVGGLELTLTPLQSMEGESDTVKTMGSGRYTFEDVSDGKYILVASGSNKSWSVKGTDTVTVLRRNDDDGATAARKNQIYKNYTAVFQNASIKGTVANDRENNDRARSSETQSGVTLELHRVVGGLKQDTVFTKKTAETGRSGEFSFTGVEEGTYVVVGKNSDGYELRANNSAPVHYSRRLVVDGRPAMRNVTSGTKLPEWDYDNSMVINNDAPDDDAGNKADDNLGDNDADFVILFKDGVVSGKVTKPDADKKTVGGDTDKDYDPYGGLKIFLMRCLKVDSADEDVCSEYDDKTNRNQRAEADTDAKGFWSAEGLLEGYYEVRVDLSGTNEKVDVSDTEDDNGAGYHDAATQLVKLVGSLDDEVNVNFHVIPK